MIPTSGASHCGPARPVATLTTAATVPRAAPPATPPRRYVHLTRDSRDRPAASSVPRTFSPQGLQADTTPASPAIAHMPRNIAPVAADMDQN